MSDKETPEQVKVVGHISYTLENSEQLPDNLQLLYEETCISSNFDEDTKSEIWKLLVRYQKCICKK